MTFVPQFPVYPPETAWMRQPKTDIPGLILNHVAEGRIAFLPADLDRRYARDHLPDHANLLANLVRWLGKPAIPLLVQGPGLLDCHLYQQQQRVILHLVNLTNTGAWRQPTDELIPVGPVQVSIQLPEGVRGGRNVRLLVCGKNSSASTAKGWSRFRITSILDHEVAVIA